MMLEREKELYSKICAASGIKFVAGEASGKTTKLTENDKFSSSSKRQRSGNAESFN